jgi:hypothetical protein
MGRAARSVLSWMAPGFWVAALGLETVRACVDGYEGSFMGMIVLLGCLAVAGTLCAAVNATYDKTTERLIILLAEATRRSPELSLHLRQAK